MYLSKLTESVMNLDRTKQILQHSGIEADSLYFTYAQNSSDEEVKPQRPALNACSFTISSGDFIAILGENGSGKSTLARHINVLLQPQSGAISIFGMAGSDPRFEQDIRNLGKKSLEEVIQKLEEMGLSLAESSEI